MRCAILCLAALVLLSAPARAQQILIDQGVRVEGLWCFPSADDPTQWYYVPMTARIANDAEGKPIFSFLRYVVNRPAESAGGEGITDASGGGILTLMATYDTPNDVVRKAERALQARLERQTEDEGAGGAEEPSVVLRGPVIFETGRYVLVSSILREDGEGGRRVLATGSAPVFEGNEVAFSFDVPAEQSTLLLESFKMATPDVSIVFEMTLAGLTDAFDAALTVDWEQVEASEAFGGGVQALGGMLAADIEQGFDELRKSDAIELVTRGENPRMQALLDKVNQRLLAMMFERVPPEREEGQQDQTAGSSMLDGLLGGIEDFMTNPGAVSKATSLWSISGRYEKKELKKSGSTTIQLNHQSPVQRNVMMVANLGDLYARFGEDSNVFRTVNLADPAYQQREIHLGIDGALLPEFEKYINGVTVTLRKKHQSGAETLREVVIEQATFDQERREFRMIYGWNGDSDRDAWLTYDYRTRWSFKGGGLYETDWQASSANMIDLYTPYRRNTVELIGDAEALRGQGVRGVSVTVEYDFFDGRRSQDLAVYKLDELDGQELEITLPLNVFDYDYSITWIRRGKPPLTASGSDDTGVIFVDDLPREEAEAS